MSYLSLYRKWRPGGFEDVLAQAHVTETLTGAIGEDRVSHAYLFSGPRGTGKTSTARILAKALNCERGVSPHPCGECVRCREIADGSSLDVFEMDAASHTSVDDVREIRDRIPFASAGGGFKVYVIDEAHQLSNPAFNALLKMLEEPPPHVVFILCTTESHKLPATVVSRCQRFEFRRIPPAAVTEHLGRVAEAEEIDVDEGALALITRHARGSVRDGLSLLDQAAGTADGRVSREVVGEILGEAPDEVLGDLAEAVCIADIPGIFRRVEELVDRGWDPRQLCRQLLEEFRALFLAARGAVDVLDADPDHRERVAELAARFAPERLDWALRALGEGQADMRLSTHPRLTLEVALARASRLEVPEEGSMLARLERLERLILSGAVPRPEVASGAPAANGAGEPAPAGEPAQAEGPAPAREEPAQAGESAQPEEPAQPEGPAPAGGSGSGDAADRWDAFLDAVKARKRTTHALIKEGWPVEASDEELVVGFERAFHAEEVRKPLHTAHLAAACEEVFGRKLRVRSQLVEGGRPDRRPAEPAPGGGDPSSSGGSSGGGSSSEHAESAVELLRRGLGAEVVDEVDS